MNEFVVTVNSKKKIVRFSENTIIYVDDKEYNQELYHLSGDTYLLKLDNKVYEISADQIDHERFVISLDGRNFDTIIRTTLQEKASKLIELRTITRHKLEVKAPMPGMVLKIKKQAGDDVIQGDSVLILEAMKMENDLRAHISGKIKSINVKEGMAVEKGYSLFIIE
jgi:acetyl/propionyl-CoA carboxylase alpha subunit